MSFNRNSSVAATPIDPTGLPNEDRQASSQAWTHLLHAAVRARITWRDFVIQTGKGFFYGLGFWTAAVVVITLWGVVLP